jgi:putative lipoprotein
LSKRHVPILLVLAVAAIAMLVALPVSAQSPAVTGAVTYLQRSALPPDAILTVRLSDVSKTDAPAEVISEQTIPSEGKQVPFPYTLPYDPAKIVENYDYAVSARIESGGKLLFISTQRYAVITRGNPTENVEIVVQPVSEPQQPATLPTTGGLVMPLAAALAGMLAGAGLLLRRTA